MDSLWAERLVAGSKTWDDMPRRYRLTVKQILTVWIEDGIISRERYEEITGGE